MTIRSTTNQSGPFKRINSDDDIESSPRSIAQSPSGASSIPPSTSPSVRNALHRPPARERNVRARIENPGQPLTQAQLPEHGYAPFHTPWLGEFHQHLNPSRDDRSGTPRLSDTESAASSMLSAPPRQRFLPTVDQFSSPLQNQYHMADGPMFPRMADHHAPDPFFALGAEFRPFHEHYPSPQDEARAANNFRRRADPMLADPLLFNQHGEDIVNALFEPMDVFEHFPPMQAMHRTVDAASYPSPTRERGHDMRALPAFQAFPELHQPRQVDPILFTTVAQLPEGWQNVAQNPDPHISDAVPHTAAADPMQEEHDPTHPQYMQWNRRGA